jgi:Domain of unknown function (DUF4157)
MSRASQLPRNVPTAHASAQMKKSLNPRAALQPQMAGRQQAVMNQRGRVPVAPPVYRPQPAPQAVQPKMPALSRSTHARPAAAPSGIIQANLIGGTHALQARLARWHTAAQRQVAPSSPQASQNLRHAQSQSNRPQTIQRKSGPGVEAFQVPLQPKSGGQPIPDQVRAKMEAAFSTDFSDVRIHVGQEASSIGALAYTWGTNIHFAPGQYNPHSIQGQKILGHELWHVVQQKSGRVSNPFGGGVAVVQDHALEAEADRMGVMAAMTALVQRPANQG